MPVGKTNQFYDMGSMSLEENMSKKVSEFTRENLYIAIPARVIGTNDYETLQCLDVQPVINDVYTKAASVQIEANILPKVFVKLWNTGGWKQKLPVAKGDLVTLHYSHKDLGEWLDSEGAEQVNQNVFEVANLEDCWVELGFGTRKKHNSPSKTDLILEGPATTITITPSGEVKVETTGSSYIKSSGHTIDTDTTITGNLTVNGNSQVDGNSNIDGNLTVTGTTTSTGVVTATTGVLAASYAGLGGGAATFNVDMNVTGTMATTGSMTINGITLETHTHTDSEGGATSPPQ